MHIYNGKGGLVIFSSASRSQSIKGVLYFFSKKIFVVAIISFFQWLKFQATSFNQKENKYIKGTFQWL